MTIAVISSLFSVGGSNVQRSTFNVQRSMFNVQRSTFNVQRSPSPRPSPPGRGRSGRKRWERFDAPIAATDFRRAPVGTLVPRSINTTTFAARDFWPRRGASDKHTLLGL